MNIAHTNGPGQPYAHFLADQPASPIAAVKWLFERADPIPGVSFNWGRGHYLRDTANDVSVLRMFTLLRRLDDEEPTALHVSDFNATTRTSTFSFFGDPRNTFALVGDTGAQFFVEPDVDLDFALNGQPEVSFHEFHEGTTPPLNPDAISVWSRREIGEPLKPATMRRLGVTP